MVDSHSVSDGSGKCNSRDGHKVHLIFNRTYIWIANLDRTCEITFGDYSPRWGFGDLEQYESIDVHFCNPNF